VDIYRTYAPLTASQIAKTANCFSATYESRTQCWASVRALRSAATDRACEFRLSPPDSSLITYHASVRVCVCARKLNSTQIFVHFEEGI